MIRAKLDLLPLELLQEQRDRIAAYDGAEHYGGFGLDNYEQHKGMSRSDARAMIELGNRLLAEAEQRVADRAVQLAEFDAAITRLTAVERKAA